MSESNDDVVGSIERYYTAKLQEFGPSARGVDWKDARSQEIRFDVLLQVIGHRQNVDLLDFGCGYGALLDHPNIVESCATYSGLDVSSDMIKTARKLHQDCGISHPTHEFWVASSIDHDHEFAVASGIFNVKSATPDAAWKAYIRDTVRMIANRTTTAFAYNCLSSLSDPEKRRMDLHYANQSEHVAFLRELGFKPEVINDYGLYEFTVFARR